MTACGGTTPLETATVETKLAGSPAAKGDRHRIVLSRPSHVGDKFRSTSKLDRSERTTRVEGERTLEDAEREHGVYLADEEEVLAVDEHHVWTKLRMTVKSLRVTEPKGESELLPAGAVLEFTRQQGFVEGDITCDEIELARETRDALEEIVSIDEVTLTNDDGFGTAEPRAVGESWKVASARLAADLGPFTTSADLIDGKTTLVAVREDRGVPCMEVATRWVARFTGSDPAMGPAIDSGEKVTDFTEVYPLDVKAMLHKGTSKTTTKLVYREGGQVRTKTVVELNEYAYERL